MSTTSVLQQSPGFVPPGGAGSVAGVVHAKGSDLAAAVIATAAGVDIAGASMDPYTALLAKLGTIASCICIFAPLPYIYQLWMSDGESIV